MVNEKATEFVTETMQLQELNVEIDQGESEHEFDFAEDEALPVVLVEILSGEADVRLNGVEGDNISKVSSIKLYLGRLEKKARHFSVKLASKGKCVIRLTVAFFKKKFRAAYDALPCTACKAVCRLAVHALLSHFAIPYIAANLTSPIDLSSPKNSLCKEFLVNYETAANNDPLKALFDHLGSPLLCAIKNAFEWADWLFGFADKLYAKACEVLRCCPSAEAHA